MTREPAIVTDGWAEVSASLAETGFFKEGQLNPATVPEILINLVRRYTTVIGYGADGTLTPIGSGTFVSRTDGQHGILTAGHVIGAIRSKENILVLPAQDRDPVTWIRIEGEGMHGPGEDQQRAKRSGYRLDSIVRRGSGEDGSAGRRLLQQGKRTRGCVRRGMPVRRRLRIRRSRQQSGRQDGRLPWNARRQDRGAAG